MMKRNFQFYKNIILVVASALTLVAVTFAWFSTSFHNGVSQISKRIGTELIYVDFYEADPSGNYQPLSGDIKLDNMISGQYKKYKFIIRTNTTDALKLNFAIDGLQSNISDAFKDAVSIKYTLKAATKTVKNGVTTYTDGAQIIESTGYKTLSQFPSDLIFGDISLANYQTATGTKSDYFVVYYEIGLSEGAGSAVQGQTSDLGTVKVTAQLGA